MNRHQATAILDRVAEGQAVATWRVMLALQLTGDLHPGFAGFARRREHPSDWREGPAAPREPHPRSVAVTQRSELQTQEQSA